MADLERRLEVRHIDTMIHNIIVYQSLSIIIFSFECVVGYVNSVTPDHQTKLKKQLTGALMSAIFLVSLAGSGEERSRVDQV